MPQDWFSQNAPKSGGDDWFAKNSPSAPKQGFLSSFDEQTGVSQMLKHPIDSILGIPTALKQEGKRVYGEIQAANAATDPVEVQRHITAAVPFMGKGIVKGGDQVDQGNYTGAAGTLAGVVTNQFGPEMLPTAAKAVANPQKAIRAAGEAAQESAGGIVNRAAGTLKSDFKRGANPGRGYLAEGGGVARSMRDLADKAAQAKEEVGKRIGDAYKQADASGKIIPVQDVANAIGGPMKEAWDVAAGPGAPEGLASSLKHHAGTFSDTIQKGIDQGGFTPSQVWDLKQKLAKGTNWSDATQLGMKQVRQQQVGALAGLLQEQIPELAQANQSYMDLIKLAGRAEERANTGSRPLTAHAWDIGSMVAGGTVGEGLHGGLGAAAGLAAAKIARSVPGRTAAATGLYNLGSGLTSIADRIEALRSNLPASTSAVISNPVGEQVPLPPQSNPATITARIQNLRRRQQ